MKPSRNSVSDLIQFARSRSPFYRALYRGLPKRIETLEPLPVVSQDAFWKANAYAHNRLLTGPLRDGIILRSGGSTGAPKFSVFSRDEWNGFTAVFARKLALCGLRDGDRVANLFYVGELYGSFIFTHKVLEECPVRLLQLPITGLCQPAEALSLLLEYEATVIAALPTTLMALAENASAGRRRGKVRLILFAGEPLQHDQRRRLLAAFPGARIASIGYASNDAGLLGYTDSSCGPNEFRCYDGHSVYELFDEETGRPITEPGRAGRAVVTALERRLMPILRYPAGDRALWLEPEGAPNRKFRLLGRSEEAARIASLSVGFDEIGAILNAIPGLSGAQFQLVMEHGSGRDGLRLRVAANIASSLRAAREKRILERLHAAKPTLKQFVAQKKVHAPRVEWREPGTLEINPRTGKLRRIIDRRAG